MKNIVKILVLSLLALSLSAVDTFAAGPKKKQKKADEATLTWQYEVEPTTGQAVQGSILVKVWSYSKKKNIALTQAGKNAVHAVLFKGVSALNTNKARVPAQRAMVTDANAETEHAEYFKEFFKEGGKYMKFVNFQNNGIPGPGDIIKVGREYKIGVSVSVSKDALRKEMEAAGIVKSLGAGF